MTTNTIVWAHSGETNAPVLNNAAGSHDALLHALLVTGWNVQTVTSIVVASGVATVTDAGHGYSDGRMVDIDGATPTALNGRKRITVVDANTFTFPAVGVADGAATGTITAKRSSVGWTRPHSSGNVSIYQRSDPTATEMMLRVNDSHANGSTATAAQCLMVWGVTDVNTYTNQVPTAAQLSSNGETRFWSKGANNATAKQWCFIGNSRCFWLFTEAVNMTAVSGYLGGGPPAFFGDIVPYKPGDPFCCAFSGNVSSTDFAYDSSPMRLSSFGASPSFSGGLIYLARPSWGLVDGVLAGTIGAGISRIGATDTGALFPSPVDGGFPIAHPMFVSESNGTFSHPLRGEWPGLGNPLGRIPRFALHLRTLPNLSGSGKDWLLVFYNRAVGEGGHAAFDLTGPWH